jgi:hypothetical protein
VNNVLVDDTTTTIPLPTVETDAAPRWRLITRIAFRLCFIYFGLYILLTQMLQAMVPLLSFPSLQTTAVISKPVFCIPSACQLDTVLRMSSWRAEGTQ